MEHVPLDVPNGGCRCQYNNVNVEILFFPAGLSPLLFLLVSYFLWDIKGRSPLTIKSLSPHKTMINNNHQGGCHPRYLWASLSPPSKTIDSINHHQDDQGGGHGHWGGGDDHPDCPDPHCRGASRGGLSNHGGNHSCNDGLRRRQSSHHCVHSCLHSLTRSDDNDYNNNDSWGEDSHLGGDEDCCNRPDRHCRGASCSGSSNRGGNS
jgi:hypothetical protein